MTTPTQPHLDQPKKQSGCMKIGLIAVAVLVGIIIFVAILVTAIGSGDDPANTDTPADPQSALVEEISDVVPDPTVSVRPGRVDVQYNIGNATPLMAQDSTLKILSAVKSADLPGGTPTVEITGNAEFTSQMGEQRDGMAFRVRYSPEILDQMHPENMRISNAWEVSDNKFVHPAMQE